MNDIDKLLNYLVEFIKDLKEENKKQKEILEILKEHISFKKDEWQCSEYLIEMRSNDTGNYTYIRLKEEKCNKLLEEWIDNGNNN